MKKLMVIIFLLNILLYNSCISNKNQTNVEIENNKFILKTGNEIYSIDTYGTSIINNYSINNIKIYELHINPSLSELIIFENNLLQNYLYTYYYIDSSNNIIILKAPPHFAQNNGYNYWSLYINNELLDDEIKIEREININEDKSKIIIFENKEEIIIMEKDNNYKIIHKNK